AGHVADRPDAVRRATAGVDPNPGVRKRDPESVGIASRKPRLSAAGDQQLARAHAGSVTESDDPSKAVGSDRGDMRAEAHVDSVFAQRSGHELARPRVLARKEPLTRLDQRHSRSEP